MAKNKKEFLWAVFGNMFGLSEIKKVYRDKSIYSDSKYWSSCGNFECRRKGLSTSQDKYPDEPITNFCFSWTDKGTVKTFVSGFKSAQNLLLNFIQHED